MLLAEKAIVFGNYSAAKIILDNARNLEPKDGIEPFLRGRIEEHFGHLQSATTYFEKASRQMPDNLGFWIARIRTLCSLGEQVDALQEIESALTAIGRNLQLELRKAVVLDNLQQLPLAIETLERSLILWPDNLSLLNTLYRLMSKAGNSTEAKRYFKDYAALKIRQNKQYTGDILQLFASIDSDSDKRNLWGLIDTHLHDFDI